ncbi:hypothetical protein ACSNOD_31880, partial [Streptomyces sp. URMC 123]
APTGRYTRWTPPGPAAGTTSLLVPEHRDFPDSADLLAEALTALSRSAAPSARDILLGLTVPSDEIRWWRDMPGDDDPLDPWPATAAERNRSWADQEDAQGAAQG